MRKLSTLCLAMGLLLLGSRTPVAAASACGPGTAESVLQGEFVAARQFHAGLDTTLLEVVESCSYPVFAGGETYTFHADDLIVGRIGWFWNFANDGFELTRDEAIAAIEAASDSVCLETQQGDGTWGDCIAQPLSYSAFKSIDDPTLGLIVYQVRGFAIQLPAGEYRSQLTSSYPGLPDYGATVYLHIEP